MASGGMVSLGLLPRNGVRVFGVEQGVHFVCLSGRLVVTLGEDPLGW